MREMLPNVRMRPLHRFSVMRLLVMSQVEILLRISSLRDILAEARTENRARVDAKELPELLAKMDDYNGDAITRFAMKLMAYTPRVTPASPVKSTGYCQ